MCLLTDVESSIIQSIHSALTIRRGYKFKFAINSQLSNTKHDSIAVPSQVVIYLTSLASGLLLNFFEFLTRWNLRSTNLAMIYLGRVTFLLGLPTRCERDVSCGNASIILSAVFSLEVSAIPDTRIRGLRLDCSGSLLLRK